ncbi:hypothetical protein F5Y04DRAFT_267392 [Hypomontagnella monticulosa]|nr:hypothetical protein F5Y04DRAFT_267392 [Hypomontagnella monticulosa]
MSNQLILPRSGCMTPSERCQGKPLFLVVRPISSILKEPISQYRKFKGYESDAMWHWALRIGDDQFELYGPGVFKKLQCFYSGGWGEKDQKAQDDGKPVLYQQRMIGFTCLTTEEIKQKADKAIGHMKKHENGLYHVRKNNCQHFVRLLANAINHDNGWLKVSTWSRDSISAITPSTYNSLSLGRATTWQQSPTNWDPPSVPPSLLSDDYPPP